MTVDALVHAFCAAAPPEWAERAHAFPGLGGALAAWVAAARAAHPDLPVDPVGLVAFVATKLLPDAEPSHALEGLATADLVLARACAQGDPLALELFVLEHGADIDRAAEKLRSTGMSAPELQSLVQERLFVHPRRIDGYAGRGPLRGWVRVVLSNLVVDLLRRHAAAPEQRATDPADLARLADVADPELGVLQERYGEPVRAALEGAFGELSARDRNLLRLRFLLGWGHDQLGARYGVHRTSAARWVAAAHQALLERARERLVASVGIAPDEFSSIARMVQSGIHLSVRRILSSSLEPEG